MTPEATLTLAVTGAALVFISLPKTAPDVVLLGALAVLLLAGAVPLDDGLAGFANPGMLAVGALYVVAAGLRQTGALAGPLRWLFGQPRNPTQAQVRLIVPTAAISAFMNNTPVVAALLPAVLDWSKRRGFTPSRLLMPLSFAAILGGTCTLIGSSTTVLVNGLLAGTQHTAMGFFTIGEIGLPIAIIGLIYIVLAGKRLLPVRDEVLSEFNDPREYTVEMLLPAGSQLHQLSLEQAGLRALPGLYVIEIIRGSRILPAPGPHQFLQEGDRLVFAGIVDSIADLQRIRGLIPATDQLFKLQTPRPERQLIEAVVAADNPMVGRTIRSGRFRSRYGAVVIAVARSGQRIPGKIGSITLAAGDTLLLEASPSFLTQNQNNRDFLLLRPLEGSVTPHYEKAWVAWLILGALISSVTLGLLPLATASITAALAMVVSGCLSTRMARRSLQIEILLVIAAALGIGQALVHTGAAKAIAEPMLSLVKHSPLGLLAVMYAITAVVSAFISNNAAAVLMFPLAVNTTMHMNLPLLPYAIVIALGASASFATPIGYQTNLMVYGPGGYRGSDFLRFGLPLNLITGVIAVIGSYWIWLK